MDLSNYILDESIDEENVGEKMEKIELLAFKNEIIHLADKLELNEKIDKINSQLLAQNAVLPLTVKLLEEKLAKMEEENKMLKDKVDEITKLGVNQLKKEEKLDEGFKEEFVKLKMENCALKEEIVGLKNDLFGQKNEIAEKDKALDEKKKKLNTIKEIGQKLLKSNDVAENLQQQQEKLSSFYEQQFNELYAIDDDPKRKEWLDEWLQFMHKINKPITRIPIMAKKGLNLYELYKLVVKYGGLVEVINKKLWQEIIKGLNLPSTITSAAFTLRSLYARYLYDYECHQHNFSKIEDLEAALNGSKRH